MGVQHHLGFAYASVPPIIEACKQAFEQAEPVKVGPAPAVPTAACSNGTDCSLSVFGAFSGSDRNGISFTSGLQLSSINQFALSSYFYAATAQVALL